MFWISPLGLAVAVALFKPGSLTELLGEQALDIQQTVSIDVED